MTVQWELLIAFLFSSASIIVCHDWSVATPPHAFSILPTPFLPSTAHPLPRQGGPCFLYQISPPYLYMSFAKFYTPFPPFHWYV